MIKAQGTLKNKIGWKSKSFFLLTIVVLLFLAINLAKSGLKSQEISQEIVSLEQEIQKLEKNNLEVKELIEYFNSTAYIEEKARIDLGLKKEGEKVVIVDDLINKKTFDSNPTTDREGTELSNPQKWWQYFFK